MSERFEAVKYVHFGVDGNVVKAVGGLWEMRASICHHGAVTFAKRPVRLL